MPKAMCLSWRLLRNRFDTLRHLELIRDAYNKWHPVLIGIESVQYQYSLVRSAANEEESCREGTSPKC